MLSAKNKNADNIQYGMAHGFENMADYMYSLPSQFENKTFKAIHNERNVLKVIPYMGEDYVVKSFKVLHPIRRIIYSSMRESKAKRSFVHSNELKRLGISTPEPVGYIEFYSNGLVKQTYYVSKKVDFDFEFRALLSGDHPELNIILKHCAQYVAAMHNRGVLHVDLSPGNILVTKTQQAYRFDIVDVNRMKFRYINEKLGVKNLTRLLVTKNIRDIFCDYYSHYRGLDKQETSAKIHRYADAYIQFRHYKNTIKKLLK